MSAERRARTDQIQAELRRWKAEASVVLAEWERVWDAAGRPGVLGKSKARATRDRVITPEIQAVLDEAVRIEAWAGAGYGADLRIPTKQLCAAVDAYLASRPT